VIDLYLSTNSLSCHPIPIDFIHVFAFLAGSEDFRAHIAAGLGPFVVLLGQDGTDKPDDGVAGGEDPDHVGPSPDLFVEAFLYPALVAGASRRGCGG
jgi:hypothetical protein